MVLPVVFCFDHLCVAIGKECSSGYNEDIPVYLQAINMAAFHVQQHSFRFLTNSLLLHTKTLSMNPAVSLINHPCVVCFMSTSMWCSRCQNVWYCSPEHLQSVRHRYPAQPAWDSFCYRTGLAIAWNASLLHLRALTCLPIHRMFNPDRLP